MMTNSVSPFFSVLVAAYNVERYLDQCLESLKLQTFQDVEFIIVDDGSTDKSNEICKKYISVDSRFKLVKHIKNQGLLSARLTGVLSSKGKKIVFLDGDDYLAGENTLSTLFEQLSQKDVDILQFNVDVVGGDPLANQRKKLWLNSGGRPQNGSVQILRLIYDLHACGWNLWNKVFSGEIVRAAAKHIVNEHHILGEDAYQLFIYAYYSKSYLKFESKPLYCYRILSGVSTSKVTIENVKKSAQEVKIISWLREFLDSQHASAYHYYLLKRLGYFLTLIAHDRVSQLPANSQCLGYLVLLKRYPFRSVLSVLKRAITKLYRKA